MIVTQWFSPNIKPVHKGWYHTGKEAARPNKKYKQSSFNWYWDGNKWFPNETSPYECIVQHRWWRGLAK